ncbi:succinate dehydrogenase cytochrome b558 subunit [Bacillus sp. 165]|uniref:succinate dehydrogenase cytochrome b558 subunit n=1 Tax=Bacillus sp. 165 TaxID=1529117 RepID=UPI001ADCBA84|nr:succinate dehydrogenase cytochrome b558 subunit [Bacillus sp. 165]MBO9130561.1 succinate dehydrogenase cytochrome b558 subunit [Bacillus sp. 165]
MNGREFANRKLHSLLGVIPVGIFLTQHLIVNQFATKGAESFNKAAGVMANLPFRYALEIFIIFLPLLYHAVYGLYIAFTAKNNVTSYSYFRNWMFYLQRLTGIITLVFVSWHVWQTRIQAAMGQEVDYEMMESILSNPGMFVFYTVGVVSTIFHFANGLWSFFISWGITVTPRSQRISTYATMIVFFLLAIMAIRTLFAFVDPQLANM